MQIVRGIYYIPREKIRTHPYIVLTAAPIVSLFQKCRKLCHLKIKHKVTTAELLDIAVCKRCHEL